MRCNSLYDKGLFYERFRTKDYVRNFTLFMQNKPKLYNHITIISPCTKGAYDNFRLFGLPKNKPKQTQNKPKVKIGKIAPKPLFRKDLYEFPLICPIQKRTQTNPKQTQFQNPHPLHPALAGFIAGGYITRAPCPERRVTSFTG